MEVAVSQATPGVLVEYARNKNISEEARRTLERIRAQKEKIAATSNDVRLAEAALNDTAADEQRIRQNIDSLRSVASQAAQVDKYAEQLAARELQITEVRDRLSRLKGELAAQQAALDGMIAKLEF
jgi:methyl-accepting chemotaxis protein